MFGLMAIIFYYMAQDGLWFWTFCALLACFVPLEALANLISLGALMVFTVVDPGLILVRAQSVSKASVRAMHHLQVKEDHS
jgi:amino acid transporter